MKTTFISYGGGVQTFAMLVLLEQDKIRADEVIFANTGAEHQETYDHIQNVVLPLLDRIKIPFIEVKMSKKVYPCGDSDHKHPVIATSLSEVIEVRSRIPSLRTRWCTEYSKITPIKNYIKNEQENGRYIKPAVALLGISLDEWQRMHRSHLSQYVAEYPLIDMRLTRKDCISLIKKSGYSLPPKSGCYFCPFQPLEQWKRLYSTEPQKFETAIRLEEQDPKFPNYSLARSKGKSLPLRQMKIRFGDGSLTLTDFEIQEMSCSQRGYCNI